MVALSCDKLPYECASPALNGGLTEQGLF